MMEYMDGGNVKRMAGRTVPARPAFLEENKTAHKTAEFCWNICSLKKNYDRIVLLRQGMQPVAQRRCVI